MLNLGNDIEVDPILRFPQSQTDSEEIIFVSDFYYRIIKYNLQSKLKFVYLSKFVTLYV